MNALIAKRTLLMNMLCFGNGIAVIRRNRYQQPVEITPYDARKVTILEDTDTGFLFYGVQTTAGVKWHQDDDIIHLKDYTFDGKKGVSVTYWQADTLKINLATKALQSRIYAQGAYMAGFISTELQLNNVEQAKSYKKAIVEALNDDTPGSFGVAVLGNGAKWNSVTRSPAEVQLIETLTNSNRDWCTVFGLPPVMLGDTEKQTSFGSGIEQMFIQVTNSILIPRATEIEQEFDYKCFRKDEIEAGYYTSINFQNLLRGDNATRGEYYAKMVSNGIFTQDEIRAWEEMGPHPAGAGARGWVQQSYMPLDKADEILKSKYSNERTKVVKPDTQRGEGDPA